MFEFSRRFPNLSPMKNALPLLDCQKHLFSLDPDVHYLNGSYMSPQLKAVEAAGLRALRRKSRPNEIAPQDFFSDPECLRGLFAQLVGASAEAVALIPAVSYGMAVVAKNLPARAGQKIVVAEAQFPSNVYPWLALAKKKGLDIQTVMMPEAAEQRGSRWNERLLEAIDERTALVAIGHIHWATGTIFDLKKVAEKVHAHGGLLVVDGTQSVGALPMDAQDLGLDALVCGGYKWLMGPYSLGYAWFGAAFLEGQPLEENWISRYNSHDFARLVDYQADYQPGARRFDVGERSNFILVPMGIAALEQLLLWQPARVQAYCGALLREAVPEWQAAGFVVDDAAQRAAHLFGIQLPAHVEAAVLQEKLRARNVQVSVRGGFVRISPNVYNDAADVAALTAVLTSF
jgi:selenocysteine lyase/cysteine desulfurase